MTLLQNAIDARGKYTFFDTRKERRIAIEAEIFINQFDTQLFRATLSNLSVSGFKITSWARLDKEQSVFIRLPGIRELKADIMWQDYRDFGCKFDSVLHPVVLDHLITSLRDFE